MEKTKECQSGITLVALVVTIIVLLILAGISIQMLTGDNGILTKAGEAKKLNNIGREKEEISLVYTSLVGKEVLNEEKITDIVFEKELNKNGYNTIVGYDDENNYLVYFNDTKRTYKVDKNGNTITELENAPSLVTETIYVTLYSDGTLAFSSNSETDSTKTVTKKYTVEKDDLYDSQEKVPWVNEVNSVKKIDFVNEILPTSTARWFRNLANLSTIENLVNLKTNRVIDMSYMFSGCGLTTLNLNTLDTRKVKSMRAMFSNCLNLTDLDLKSFNTSEVTDMYSMFYNCKKITNLDLSNFDTSSVTNMRSMFNSCSGLTSLNVSNFDTSNVTTMYAMFSSCSILTSLNLSSFNTSKVTDMYCMFYHCNELTSLDLSRFDTSNVTTMYCMFCGCNNLTSIDLSRFDTGNVTTMYCMFCNCNKLTSLDLSHFNTNKVNSMQGMFQNCWNLTSVNVSKFDTSNVTTMRNMFYSCIKLQELDLSSFDTRNLEITRWMFCGWDDKNDTDLVMEIKKIYVSSLWKMSKITDDYNMFSNCRNLVGGNGTTYSYNKKDSSYARIDGGPKSSTPGYFTYKGN